MGASGAAAGAASLASAGLSAYSTMLKAEGVAAADEFQAQKLDTASKYGELKAVQTGGQMTRSINRTLGNIDAVRAAANTDPNSPTGVAIRDNQAAIGAEQRDITVNSILQQSRQDTADAKYYRSAADRALVAGEVSAGAGLLKSFASIIPGGG